MRTLLFAAALGTTFVATTRADEPPAPPEIRPAAQPAQQRVIRVS